MHLQLTCKLYDEDAKYFIDPILKVEEIQSLTLYRDEGINSTTKINTVTSNSNLHKYLKLIVRFFNMLLNKKKIKAIIGIYEIPHGLMAMLCGKILNKSVIICIIGNPKFEMRNTGIRGWITDQIYSNADIITVTGSNAKAFLIERKKINQEKIYILPNSIPTENFENLYTKKKYDLITLGRLSSEKGLFILLKIINKLKKEFPTIKLAIAGKGPLFEKLRESIIELELVNNVELLGYVDDVAMFINSGKIFITTSKTEGLPRTVIQSMSCGTPVVASNVGDMSDLIIQNKNGYLVNNFNDIDTFCQKIRILLSNEKKRLFFSSESTKYTKNNFDHICATKVWHLIFKKLNRI